MIVRRIKISLPARLKQSAAADARMIAEAIAQATHAKQASGHLSLRLPGNGEAGAPIALRAGLAAKGGRHGG
ncbi:MAG: hypothetical protein AAF667_04645 [Pseudomonadota bacterium]